MLLIKVVAERLQFPGAVVVFLCGFKKTTGSIWKYGDMDKKAAGLLSSICLLLVLATVVLLQRSSTLFPAGAKQGQHQYCQQ